MSATRLTLSLFNALVAPTQRGWKGFGQGVVWEGEEREENVPPRKPAL